MTNEKKLIVGGDLIKSFGATRSYVVDLKGAAESQYETCQINVLYVKLITVIQYFLTTQFDIAIIKVVI